MHGKKCNKIIFNNNSSNIINNEIAITLFKESIPSCKSLKFLGLTLDIGLNFSDHIKDIKKKCLNRLNIIKILSNKKWSLEKDTLTTIYLSLIRSIMDYSSIIIPFLAKSLEKTLQSVQNTALKCIYKLPYITHTEDIIKITNLNSIKERAHHLNKNFISNSLKFRNELLLDLIDEYKLGGKQFKNKTFLCIYKNLFLQMQ